MRVAAATLAAFAAYLLFAGTLSISEVATGLILSSVGVSGVVVIGRIAEPRFQFLLASLRPCGRALGRLPISVLQTGVALAQACRLPGNPPIFAREQPFRHGARADPAERGRRAIAVLAASLAPDSFVVRAEIGRDAALIHAIGRPPSPMDPDWLA